MAGQPSTDTRRQRPFVGSLTYNARPISLNASYGHFRTERTAHVIEWRNAFFWLAREARIPPLDAIEVTVSVGMSGRLQDIGNAYVSAKAAIDGLVQAKVIPDDTGEHLLHLGFTPPVRVPPKEPDYLTLHIVEHTADRQKRVAGALRDTINQHGPITSEWIGSATKRILGLLR